MTDCVGKGGGGGKGGREMGEWGQKCSLSLVLQETGIFSEGTCYLDHVHNFL